MPEDRLLPSVRAQVPQMMQESIGMITALGQSTRIASQLTRAFWKRGSKTSQVGFVKKIWNEQSFLDETSPTFKGVQSFLKKHLKGYQGRGVPKYGFKESSLRGTKPTRKVGELLREALRRGR